MLTSMDNNPLGDWGLWPLDSNGRPFEVPHWRLAPAERSSKDILNLPVRPDQPDRVPDAAAVDFKDGTALGQIKVLGRLERRRMPLVFTDEHVNIPARGPSG